MLDQPSDILNVRLGWDYKDFSTRITFRYQGEVLNSLDIVHSLLDGYTKSLFQVDWQAKQKLFENFSILFDISNLNQYIDDSITRTSGRSFPSSSNSYGLVVQAGLRYEY